MTVDWQSTTKQPFKVQEMALEKSYDCRKYGWLMEMGLGKTGVTLNDFARVARYGHASRALVVCPPSLRTVWSEQAEEFFPGLPVRIWKDSKWHGAKDALLSVMNYESMLGQGKDVALKLIADRKTYVALDESVCIKNWGGKLSKKVMELRNDAAFTRILTGLPNPQSNMDFWTQGRFIGLFSGVNPVAFKNRYCRLGGYMGKQIIGPKNEEELQAILATRAFVAKKTDWTDIPEKLYSRRDVEIKDPAQLRAYRELKTEFYAMLESGEEVSAEMVITSLMKMQQVSCGFLYTDSGKTEWLVPPEKNPKVQELGLLKEQVPGKLIQFAVHKPVVAMLHEVSEKEGRRPAIITGGMEPEEIEEQKRRFNNDPECRDIICQIQSAKYGHTLLGQAGERTRCCTSVFFETSYDLDARAQAEDRNHRHGQDSSVTIMDLAASPEDRKAIHALKYKRSVSDEFTQPLAAVNAA